LPLLASACSEQIVLDYIGDIPVNTKTETIVVEQTLDAPIAIVWDAITNQSRMPHWFFEQIIDFRPEVGFETQFVVNALGKDYLHLWKILDVDIEKRIVYQWRYGKIPGTSTVNWELSTTPAGTLLRVSHEGHENFPQDDTVFNREAGLAGWKYFIQERLPAFLENC